MKNRLLIKMSLLLCLLLSSNIYGKNLISLDELESSGKFNSFNIDINNDGILDKVLSAELEESDKLYIFKKTDNKYNLIFEGVNLSYDGIYRILKIQQEKKGIAFSIHTQFTSNGSDKIIYYVSYKNSNFTIKKIIYTLNSWQEDYTKTYICTVKENTNLNKVQALRLAPSEEERDKLCRVDYYMEDSLAEFTLRFKDMDNPNLIRDIDRYKVLLKKFPLVIKTLTPYNNIAYYLQKSGANKEAVYLLEKIIEKFPKRTVAYYNLADVYWALGRKKEAKKMYATYVKQMTAQGKEKPIPKVVKQRVSGRDI